MTIKIGAIIKRLRTEKNTTQETLAAALGVTPQAVSRWESECCYPDMELLPALADYFSVSVDELIGYNLSDREADIKRVRRQMERLSETGTDEEQLSFARNAYARYPYLPDVKVYLAMCLSDLYTKTGQTSHFEEAKNLCMSVINDNCGTEDRYDSITTLSRLYRQAGKADKAKETLDLLVPMKYCRESALSCGIGDGNTEYYIQDEIDKLTDCLGTAIRGLAVNEDVPNDPSTWEKKIEILKTSNELYKMIYGDNLMFFHIRLSMNYRLISTFELSLGRMDDALSSLEKMCRHTIAYDKSYADDRGKNYSSIFTDKLTYSEASDDLHELKEHTWSYHMLDCLRSRLYDAIRNTGRFKQIVKSLEEYAK